MEAAKPRLLTRVHGCRVCSAGESGAGPHQNTHTHARTARGDGRLRMTAEGYNPPVIRITHQRFCHEIFRPVLVHRKTLATSSTGAVSSIRNMNLLVMLLPRRPWPQLNDGCINHSASHLTASQYRSSLRLWSPRLSIYRARRYRRLACPGNRNCPPPRLAVHEARSALPNPFGHADGLRRKLSVQLRITLIGSRCSLAIQKRIKHASANDGVFKQIFIQFTELHLFGLAYPIVSWPVVRS